MNTKDEFRLLSMIHKLEIFRALDVTEGKLILSLCEHVDLKSGDLVWEVGDKSDTVLILLTGRLAVLDADGETTGSVAPGESYGEMGVLTGHERFVGIRAVEPSTALCLHRRHLKGLSGKDREIYVKILETAVDLLSHRLTSSRHTSH